MDILAHTLWTNAGAREANKILEKKKKPSRISVGWAAFWGIFPDLFAFTIPFVIFFYAVIFQGASFADFSHHRLEVGAFKIAPLLYQYSHSLVIWAVVFLITWAISRRPRFELLGWALHILIDIPSHAGGFYLTPFLFPLSGYHFTHGIPWSNRWYMIINYSLLLFVWLKIFIKKRNAEKK